MVVIQVIQNLILIRQVKQEAEKILNETDWYVTRKSEKSTAIPSAITTHRDAVRTKQAEMETAITNAADTPALETLYTYTVTDGVQSRPLGDLPRLTQEIYYANDLRLKQFRWKLRNKQFSQV